MSRRTVVGDSEEVVSSDEEEEEQFNSFVENNEDKFKEACQKFNKFIYERNIISAVRKFPAIWDKGDVQYKNISSRPLLWNKVASEVGRGTWVDAKSTWNTLNRNYGRYRRTLKLPSGIATAEVKGVSWPHFQAMHQLLAKNLSHGITQQRNSNFDKNLQKPRKSPQYRMAKAEERKKARKDSATAHGGGLSFPTNTEWTSPDFNFQPTNEGFVNSIGEAPSSLPATDMYKELEQEVISSHKNKVGVCSESGTGASENFISADKFLREERPIKVEEGIPEATSQEPPIQAENISAGHSSPSGHASQDCTSCQVLGGKLGFAETRTTFLEMKVKQLECRVKWSQQFQSQCEELQRKLLACQQKTINCLESCAAENICEIREKLQEILQSTYI